jgi:hypothetical protein
MLMTMTNSQYYLPCTVAFTTHSYIKILSVCLLLQIETSALHVHT